MMDLCVIFYYFLTKFIVNNHFKDNNARGDLSFIGRQEVDSVKNGIK